MPSSKPISVRAHAVVTPNGPMRNAIVTYNPNDTGFTPRVTPFSTELHTTTAVNGIIIIAPDGYSIPPLLEARIHTADLTIPGNFDLLLRDIADSLSAHDGSKLQVLTIVF